MHDFLQFLIICTLGYTGFKFLTLIYCNNILNKNKKHPTYTRVGVFEQAVSASFQDFAKTVVTGLLIKKFCGAFKNFVVAF